MAKVDHSLGRTSSGGSINQNNIFRIITVNIDSNTLSNTVVASAINALPAFTVTEISIPTFIVVNSDSNGFIRNISRYRLIDTGKGNYGTGGTVLTGSKLLQESYFEANTNVIELFESTDIIDLGEIGFTEISDYVNQLDPSIIIQDQADGYTIIRTTINGYQIDYLFLGNGGTYGLNDDSTISNDFQLLNNPFQLQDFHSVLNQGSVSTLGYTLTDEDNVQISNHSNLELNFVDISNNETIISAGGGFTNTDINNNEASLNADSGLVLRGSGSTQPINLKNEHATIATELHLPSFSGTFLTPHFLVASVNGVYPGSNGNVEIANGNQDLQSVLEEGGYATSSGLSGYSNFDLHLGQGDGYLTVEVGTDTLYSFVEVQNDYAQLSSVEDYNDSNAGYHYVGVRSIGPDTLGPFMNTIRNTNKLELNFEDPIAPNVQIKVPAKAVNGIYTLATLDDITSGVSSVTGTTNRITSTGGLTPVIDIASTYVGQSSITTLGTIATGVWNGTPITDSYISSAATWNAKQAALVSGTNIKTVGGVSILGSGDLTEVQNSLTASTTLAPSVTAVNTGLALKMNKPSFAALTSSYSLTSTTALQKIFNVATDGGFNAQANKVYEFEVGAMFTLDGTSASIGFGFLGTATISDCDYQALSLRGLSTTTAGVYIEGHVTTSTTVTTVSTGTFVRVHVRGIIRTTSAGTIIPAVSASSAPTTWSTKPGSFFKIEELGTNTDTNSSDFS